MALNCDDKIRRNDNFKITTATKCFLFHSVFSNNSASKKNESINSNEFQIGDIFIVRINLESNFKFTKTKMIDKQKHNEYSDSKFYPTNQRQFSRKSKVVILVIIFVYVYILYSYLKLSSDNQSSIKTKYSSFHCENNSTLENHPMQLDDGITNETKRYIELLELTNPGENGDAIILPKNLPNEIQEKIDEGNKIDGCNSFLSSFVSLNRKLPDVRPKECKQEIFTNLPKASVIIGFHNEVWSVLLRTVHSVINNSPLHLIEEIILIDDASYRGSFMIPISLTCTKKLTIQYFRLPDHSTRRTCEKITKNSNRPLGSTTWSSRNEKFWCS